MINSDFKDTYDKFLDEDVNLRRFQGDMPKDDGLILLHAMGFKVPTHGSATDMLHSLVKEFYDNDINKARADAVYSYYNVVVIPDAKKHDAKALTKVHIEKAAQDSPRSYVTQFLPQSKPITYTMMKIGGTMYWYESSSDDEFRSNVGKVKTRLFDSKDFTKMQGLEESVMSCFMLPVMSIDFLTGKRGEDMVAVDLNVAPSVKGTPLEDLDQEEIAGKISRFIRSL